MSNRTFKPTGFFLIFSILKWYQFKRLFFLLKFVWYDLTAIIFWQVRCCAHRTRSSCQKYIKYFFKFLWPSQKTKKSIMLFLNWNVNSLLTNQLVAIRVIVVSCNSFNFTLIDAKNSNYQFWCSISLSKKIFHGLQSTDAQWKLRV